MNIEMNHEIEYIGKDGITDESSPKSLIDELADLMKGLDLKTPEIDEEVISFSDISKITKSSDSEEDVKRKKKKKKKNSLIDIDGGVEPRMMEDIDGNLIEIEMPTSMFIDMKEELFEDDDDDDFVDKIVDPNRSAYKKLKKDANKYKREVAEELTLLYDLLGETDKFSKNLSKRYSEMVNNRKSGGVTKYSVELASAVLASKQNKLAIIKEISNIKKAVIDLKLKAEAQEAKLKAMDGGSGADADIGLMGSNYLQSILDYGRKNVTEAITGGADIYSNESYYYNDENEQDDTDEEDDPYGMPDPKTEVTPMDYADDMNNSMDYDALIEDRLNRRDGHPFRRTDNGTKYIEYETRDVKVKIAYDNQTDDYKFFAEDKNGEIIGDYPLPSEDRELNPIRFSQDMKHGTDRLGRVYKVVQF